MIGFDPTAFDNLKILIEGSVYDFDLSGRIYIKNRSDLIDLANMSRTYKIEVACHKKNSLNTATLILSTNLQELSKELLHQSSTKFGCNFKILYSSKSTHYEMASYRIRKIVKHHFDEQYTVLQNIMFQSHHSDKTEEVYTITTEAILNTLLYEEDVEDIPYIINNVISTLQSIYD
ncbi:hypothetical protein EJF36_10700 [Bacillus sp. HMF5848]|uniref:hypothetical protein n=1 Tax=Bacillus sp. HMF5848 TaxID=2495421 RepID=UPI000F7AC1C8|nr:hypothetical protein [Bacillus sp. HMF5848]RSK27315.1 hypothetical protein EJF36_10700 [Bacillus sp. HMF5848]